MVRVPVSYGVAKRGFGKFCLFSFLFNGIEKNEPTLTRSPRIGTRALLVCCGSIPALVASDECLLQSREKVSLLLWLHTSSLGEKL